MPKALFVEVEARKTVAEEIRTFLEKALAKAQKERDTRDWYAVRFDEQHFGIFDTFDGNKGRNKHIAGAIVRGLVIKTITSLHGMPHVSLSEIVAAVVPRQDAVPVLGSYVEIQTRMGQGRDFGEVLVKARENAAGEEGTIGWYALRTGKNSYAVFDSFNDEASRELHLTGIFDRGIMAAIDRFCDVAPTIRKFEIIASKQSGWTEIALAQKKMHSELVPRVGPKSA